MNPKTESQIKKLKDDTVGYHLYEAKHNEEISHIFFNDTCVYSKVHNHE